MQCGHQIHVFPADSDTSPPTLRYPQYQQAMLNFRDNMARVYQINTDPSKPFW